jgi:cytochrome c-type biogenesis protein CcmH
VRRLASILAALCLFVFAAPGFSVEPSEMLANPALEARARAISEHLRCVVCQNQTIDDSDAPLAHDMRMLVRERLTAGDTDQQVIDYIVARYGNFVLLRPPFQPDTWALWIAPFAVLALASLSLLSQVRQRGGPHTAAPLSEAERRKLDALTAGRDDGPSGAA